MAKFAALDKGDESDGYLYVRCRAISSRVNKNNDGWPSEELSKAYSTFVGRPVFVDHNNDDPKRTRGVIVDSKLHVDDDEKTSALDPYYSTAPDNHKPPTWIELLIEVDGKTYPKLAEAIRKEDIDAVSMGANIKQSVCSVCANEASTPDEFCDHIKKKGLTFEVTSADGETIRKKAYEDCMGVDFFEISFVFDPADETALISEKKGAVKEALDPTYNAEAMIQNHLQDGHNPPEPTCPLCQQESPELSNKHQVGLPAPAPALSKAAAEFYEDDSVEDPNYPNGIKCVYCHYPYNASAKAPCENCGRDPLGLNVPRRMPRDKIQEDIRYRNGGLAGLVGQNLSMETVAALKESYPQPSDFVEPINADHGQGGDSNYIPQSDKVTAPQEVNTLRNENLCPVCKASIMEPGRDGILECGTCGHVAEPEPLNNPDLSLSQDQDLRQDNAENLPQEGTQEQDDSASQITFTPSVARKQKDTKGVISDMFTTILTTASEEVVDKILPVVKTGRVETLLGSRMPFNNGTYAAMKEAGILDDVSVEYPAVERKIKLVETPPIFNLFAAEESAMKLQIKLEEVPVVIEAPTQEAADKAAEIITAALAPKEAAVTKPKSKNTILPAGKVISDNPKDEKVISDQLAPVESAVTINIGDTPDPVDEPAEAVEEPVEETVVEAEVSDEESAPEDTSSVEDVVEDVEDAESKDEDSKESAEDKEAKLLTAFRLADLSVELGLVEAANKMVFIAELEEETIDALEAREKTLSSVKTAGLKKNSSRVAGLQRIPRLSHTKASVGENLVLDVLDEQIFL